jgi:hypothetical protein
MALLHTPTASQKTEATQHTIQHTSREPKKEKEKGGFFF